jgi:glycosyltransferase involved in cell wall biosynthesis
MSVHNGQRFLQEALSSVSSQDLADYEFVIVDDGSTDATAEILRGNAVIDRRLRIVRNSARLGLTRSLNRGLESASGEFVARIDADDICLPGRLARQYAFLRDSTRHIAVACGVKVIDEAGKVTRVIDQPLDDWQIRFMSGFNPPAPHPTYFFKRRDPAGKPIFYDESFETAQDFDLWSRLAAMGSTAVLGEVLVAYRRHGAATTVTKRLEQAANCRIVGARNLERLLSAGPARILSPLQALFAYEVRADAGTIRGAVNGCDVLLKWGLSNAPTPRHRRWVRVFLAGLLADAALSRGGALKRPSALAAFLFTGRKYLPGLAAAALRQPSLAIKSLRAVRGVD